MKKNYQYIAFDLDGTLSDPARGLIEGFVYAFRKLGIDYGSRESLRRFIGPSLFDEWQEAYGFTPDEARHAIDVFREYYNIYGWRENEMYEGIPEMLSELKRRGKKLTLATSKPEQTAKMILSMFGIDKYFDFIGGAANDPSRDHKSTVLRYSLENVGCTDPSSAILVGDRKYDAEGARIVGIDSLAVMWGHGTREELEAAGFTASVDTPAELLEFFK